MESSHHKALETKHAGYEALIREEQSRPQPDAKTIQELKRKKLRLKEELVGE